MEVSIAVRPPFSWTLARDFVRRFPPCRADHVVEPNALYGALAVLGGAVGWRLTPSAGSQLRLEVEGADSSAALAATARTVAHFVSADDDLSDFYARAANDHPRYRALVAGLHGLHHVRFLTLAEITCYAILMQRTPIALAARQKRKLVEAFGRSARIGPHTLRAFPDFATLRRLDVGAIAGAIGHRHKAERMVHAIVAIDEIGEDFLRRAPYDDAEAALRAIPGIGPFSAAAILLRGLGRMDRVDPRFGAFGRAGVALYGSAWDPDAIVRRYGATIGYWSYYLRVGSGD